MGKYLVDLVKDEKYPYVPIKCLAPQNAGIFRPIDIVNGDLVVLSGIEVRYRSGL